jgi:hypothetical protein
MMIVINVELAAGIYTLPRSENHVKVVKISRSIDLEKVEIVLPAGSKLVLRIDQEKL